MFTLDQTTGSIVNALKHLMDDPCAGKLEVAIHSNVSRSQMWLLVRWGRYSFITLPAPKPVIDNPGISPQQCADAAAHDASDHFKWFECRDGEQTIYSGKQWFCAVTTPVEPTREMVRDAVTKALGALRSKLVKEEERIYKLMQQATTVCSAH